MTINQHRARTLRLHLAACLIFAALALPAFATPWTEPIPDDPWPDSPTGCHAGDCNPKPKPEPKPEPELRVPEREGSGKTPPHDGRAYSLCKWQAWPDGRRYISVKTAGVHHADQSAWALARRQLAHDQCRVKLGVK